MDAKDWGPGGPPRLICRCIGVSSTRILDAIRKQDLTQLEQVQESVRAGTGCGTCHPEIEEILAEIRGEPIAKLARMENRMICREETHQRIEASLFSGIVPKLPPQTAVELIAIEGLEVRLHLQPDRPELRELVEQKLQKLVCCDLEVRFS